MTTPRIITFDSSVGMEAVIGVAFGIVAYVWNMS